MQNYMSSKHRADMCTPGSERQKKPGNFGIKKAAVWHLDGSLMSQGSVSVILPMPVDMVTCCHTGKLPFFLEHRPLPLPAFEESDLLLELQSEDIWPFLG